MNPYHPSTSNNFVCVCKKNNHYPEKENSNTFLRDADLFLVWPLTALCSLMHLQSLFWCIVLVDGFEGVLTLGVCLVGEERERGTGVWMWFQNWPLSAAFPRCWARWPCCLSHGKLWRECGVAVDCSQCCCLNRTRYLSLSFYPTNFGHL